MPAYVRVRKLDELRLQIDAVGTQTDVAAAAELSLQRINQLYTGSSDVVEVRKAARLEDTLGLPRGSLFHALDADLLRPYMAGGDHHNGETNGHVASLPPYPFDLPAPPAYVVVA